MYNAMQVVTYLASGVFCDPSEPMNSEIHITYHLYHQSCVLTGQ